MTTITFKPDPAHQSVNWDDPARWTGGIVPNDPTVDVIIPTTTEIATGNPYHSTILEAGVVAVGSLTISNNAVELNNTLMLSLTVTHGLNLSAGSEIDLTGASLSAASIDNNGFDIQGGGSSINVTGLFLNESQVVGSGMTLTAGSLTNPGSLIAASGNLTVTVGHGGFTNLSGSTLSGGSYQAGSAGRGASSSILYLDVGGVIGTDAANIALYGPGEINSFDDASHGWVSITSSMHSIAASGTLALGTNAVSWSNLTVDGSITLTSATLQATQLTVDAGGIIKGNGALGGPILNNGTIAVQLIPDGINPSLSLLITGPVTGSGTMEITPSLGVFTRVGPDFNHFTLELGAAASSNVLFDDGYGILILDDQAEFSGKIRPAAAGDQFIVRGTSFDSVTGYSYSGDSHGGTLAVQTTGGEIDLQFLGNFVTADFSLAAGPQLLSSDPERLLITNTGSAPTVLAPIAEDSGVRLITQAELLSGFVGTSPVAGNLAIATGNGTLVDNHDGTWSYTAAHNDDSAVSFSYKVTYGGGPVAESATLDITPVNDAPVNTVPAALGTSSNVDFAIAGLSVSDVDATSLTTTLHVDHGTLAVAAIGGATVGGSGTATVTLTGSVAQIDAALSATNNVLYHSAFDFSGIDHLTMTSNDGGSSGAGGAMTDTDIVNIQVDAANAPPHLALGGNIALQVVGTFPVLGGIGATSAISLNVPGPSDPASAGVPDFTFAAADAGHSPDVNSPGLPPQLSDFHLI